MTKYILISILAILIWGCSDNSVSEKQNIVEEKRGLEYVIKSPEELPKLNHNLSHSNYFYPIEISNIDFEMVKNAFTIKEEQYSVSKPIDGLNLIVKYKMTNPYDKEMVVPIPDYFYITADDIQSNTTNSFYSKGDRCYMIGGAELTYKGKKLYEIYDERIENGYGLKFKPKESKEFKITFDHPINCNMSKLALIGFSEKDNGTTNRIGSGVEIDVKSKTILRQVRVY